MSTTKARYGNVTHKRDFILEMNFSLMNYYEKKKVSYLRCSLAIVLCEQIGKFAIEQSAISAVSIGVLLRTHVGFWRAPLHLRSCRTSLAASIYTVAKTTPIIQMLNLYVELCIPKACSPPLRRPQLTSLILIMDMETCARSGLIGQIGHVGAHSRRDDGCHASPCAPKNCNTDNSNTELSITRFYAHSHAAERSKLTCVTSKRVAVRG